MKGRSGNLSLVCLLVVGLFSLKPVPAYARDDGMASGVIKNTSGRTLSNITVSLLNASDNTVVKAISDVYGRYTFRDLPYGNYRVLFQDINPYLYTTDTPYPDQGRIYLDHFHGGAAVPTRLNIQNSEPVNLPQEVMPRVDATDNRVDTISVNECDSFGSVKEIGTLAAALAGGRQINFSCNGKITVPELAITRDTIINAADNLTLSGANTNRLFRVQPGVLLILNNVTITESTDNGTTGSAIYNLGDTRLFDSKIFRNRGNTGVIFNLGRLHLERSSISNNSLNYESALSNYGRVTGKDVTIGSHVPSAGPAVSNYGVIEFEGCTITGIGTNNVYAVSNNQGARLSLNECEVFDNLGASFVDNNGTLIIENSHIDRNRGDQPLIDSSGVLELQNTSITRNDMQNSMVFNEGLADIINTTISGNSSGPYGDGDYGGAALANQGLMRVKNSTIYNNLYGRQVGNAGQLTLSNSIIVGNGESSECGGLVPITSEGYNLHTDASCSPVQTGDLAFGFAGLDVLNANGGIGLTHALLVSSDAVDNGNCSDGVVTLDQRGIVRPQGGACDIGAYERSATSAESDALCSDASFDSDGDGWGWENGQSCLVQAITNTDTTIYCSSAAFDSDGDGWGWENNTSCVMQQAPVTPQGRPVCSSAAFDSDGDGFGWENSTTCIVQSNPQQNICSSTAADTDGDGWGWEDNSSCRVQ